jgi:type IV pilus assembly protein PilV
MNNRFQPGDMGAKQSGVLLLEALIAILVFSLGVLTVIGLQAASIRMAAEAQLRTNAALLADQLVGQMWASGDDIPTLKTKFESPSGASYTAWVNDNVKSFYGLPGIVAGTDTAPVVSVNAADGVNKGQVVITLKWRTQAMSSSDSPRKHTVTSQISRNPK